MARALKCETCNRIVENVGETAVKVRCSWCVLSVVGIPKEKSVTPPSGRPAGWHFMAEFVDKDGKVFHLKPTKVKPPKKKAKRRSKEEILIAREVEKKAALKKAVEKQKDFLNHKFGG